MLKNEVDSGPGRSRLQKCTPLRAREGGNDSVSLLDKESALAGGKVSNTSRMVSGAPTGRETLRRAAQARILWLWQLC